MKNTSLGSKTNFFSQTNAVHFCSTLDENFQIIRKLVEDVGNLFENANQAMMPKSHSNRNEDDDIRVRLQDMDKVKESSVKLFDFVTLVTMLESCICRQNYELDVKVMSSMFKSWAL